MKTYQLTIAAVAIFSSHSQGVTGLIFDDPNCIIIDPAIGIGVAVSSTGTGGTGGASSVPIDCVYDYQLSADNDFALYTANGTGFGITNVVQEIDKTTPFNVVESGIFNSSSEYIYVIAMEYTVVGSFAGHINGIDISTVAWEVTGDIASALTGFAANDPAYNPDISNATILMATETFTGPAALTGSLFGVAAPGVADALDVPGPNSAVIFRTRADNFCVTPEPSSALLLGLGGLSLLLRRRR